MGIVERSRVKGPLGSVFGENQFYRETQGTRLGGRLVAKSSSDPRVAYPEVKFIFGTWCEVWVLLPSLPQGGQYSGKFVLSSPRG